MKKNGNPKISVITPSVRGEGLPLVQRALRHQDFQDFEWIIVGGWKNLGSFATHLQGVSNNPKYPAEYPIMVDEPKKLKGDVWSLNKAYNAGLREAKGELIVSWQDYTFARPDALQGFWEHFKEEPNTLVSGLGNKYETDSWDVMIWEDPRGKDTFLSYYPTAFNEIEWNFCSVPKQALYDVGGFIEDFDQGYGMDAYNVNERIASLGKYDFKIDQSLKSYSLPHGRVKDWEEKNWIHENRYGIMKEKMIKEGKWPIAPYLTNVRQTDIV
jgi:hypothetical protein